MHQCYAFCQLSPKLFGYAMQSSRRLSVWTAVVHTSTNKHHRSAKQRCRGTASGLGSVVGTSTHKRALSCLWIPLAVTDAVGEPYGSSPVRRSTSGGGSGGVTSWINEKKMSQLMNIC